MDAKMILLKNGECFISGKLKKSDIFISEGKIKKIGNGISTKDVREIDCSGKIILPGFIDCHVHFRDPGLTHKEDFHTGSMAAASGGITTVLDMPNTKPATLTVKDLEGKRKIAAGKSVVNYGFHFGSSIDNISEIKKAKNIASTKIFMNWSTGNMKIDDPKKLEEIFLASRIVSVHAEGEQVAQAVNLAKKTKTKLYLCHISSKDEIDFLRKNKSKDIFVEVTPHHLYLTEKPNDNFFSVKPCLKKKEDIDALWDAINEGLIDTIGTDHAPHTIEEKNAKEAPSGMPGEETLVPAMMDAVNKGKITLQKVVELCAENPAKIFGMPKKGFLKEGFDADLVVIDMTLVKKVIGKKLFTKCKWSAFENQIFKGWPIITIVNGNVVFSYGKINDKLLGKEVKFKY